MKKFVTLLFLIFAALLNAQMPLLANSETHFYSTSQFFNIHFNETNNTVEGFDLMT